MNQLIEAYLTGVIDSFIVKESEEHGRCIVITAYKFTGGRKYDSQLIISRQELLYTKFMDDYIQDRIEDFLKIFRLFAK